MRTKIKFWIQATMIALSSLLLVTNCTKDDDVTNEANIPIVNTNEVTEITKTTATSGGVITSDGGASIIVRGVCWSTNNTPTIADSKTQDGSEVGSFTSAITGLANETTYYIRAYAINSNGTGYGSAKSFTTLEENNTNNGNNYFNPDITYGSMSDIDENTYKTVTIGNQIWMAENLKTTKYNDSSEIPYITSDTKWSLSITGAYCNYDNLESNATTYGRLYNWHAVNTGKLAPEGWHVPTDADWTILEKYMITNGYNYDGTKDADKIAKSLCSTWGWSSSTSIGSPGKEPELNNSTGFAALPGGYRNYNDGYFSTIWEYGNWWSSTEFSEDGAYYRYLYYDIKDLRRIDGNYSKGNGFSVRLVRD